MGPEENPIGKVEYSLAVKTWSVETIVILERCEGLWMSSSWKCCRILVHMSVHKSEFIDETLFYHMIADIVNIGRSATCIPA